MADFFETHDLKPAFAGMKADAGNDRIESFPCKSFVPFGNVAVVDGSGAISIGLEGRVAGLAVHTHTIPDTGYRQYDCASLMTDGVIWARAKGAPADGAPVFFDADGVVQPKADGLKAYPHALFRGPLVTLKDGTTIALVQLAAPLAA